MDNPVQIIVAAFSTPEAAGETMDDLKQGRKEGLIGILDAAVVVKDADGKLKVTDAKRRGRKGLITGGLVGGVIGLLVAPPVAAVAVTGGAIGTLIGKLQGAPLKAEMKNIASALPPNSSAIVAVIEHTWVSQLKMALMGAGAQLVEDAIKADIAAQLNAGGNVVYTAGIGELGSGIARVASNEDSLKVTGGLMGDSGILVNSVEITDEPLEADEPTADTTVS